MYTCVYIIVYVYIYICIYKIKDAERSNNVVSAAVCETPSLRLFQV